MVTRELKKVRNIISNTRRSGMRNKSSYRGKNSFKKSRNSCTDTSEGTVMGWSTLEPSMFVVDGWGTSKRSAKN